MKHRPPPHPASPPTPRHPHTEPRPVMEWGAANPFRYLRPHG
ncbi:hypothetical protein SLNWT_4099 [Streptomyces albus]|uniref:Uncharacterized protein n=1 Tax=Streptomyces albus (strain ATCC 21838 / DSM 41398 / FERM P-419 / JCM 4703 / NBRC 107858) TaxID=1081613 RepID=A0A0B5EYL3_STRA4|nr:hypothetical protein SLNWT_4099 [Streptomyces albus]